MSPRKSPEGPMQPEGEGHDLQNTLPAEIMEAMKGGDVAQLVKREKMFEFQGQRQMGQNGVSDEATRALIQHVPVLHDFWKNVGTRRLGELYWLKNKPGQEPVDDVAEHFRRIVFILMGRRLGGYMGERVTPEGKGRIELLLQFLKLGVLRPEEFRKATLVFSGHEGESAAFFSHFLVDAMNSEFPWKRFLGNMNMETDAKFSNENISFGHDDVLENENFKDVCGEKAPILWIICSTDFHIQSLLIAHASCDGEPGSPLAPVLQQEETHGDRVAFLSAPNPYRHSTDPGVRASQRVMEATFYFGQAVLNNLGSLLDVQDPEFQLRGHKDKEGKFHPIAEKISPSRMEKLQRSQKYRGRYATRVYKKGVELFKLLPLALEYIIHMFPERAGQGWKDTCVGPHLTEIDKARRLLDWESWSKSEDARGKHKGTFGDIMNCLEQAEDDGESVKFSLIDSIFTEIRETIIEDIRHWGDPENSLKQPKQ